MGQVFVNIAEDQYLCVVELKYIYRNVYFTTYNCASKVFNLLTVCGEIRQTLDAKIRHYLGE